MEQQNANKIKSNELIIKYIAINK